jgi:hypothetical protein
MFFDFYTFPLLHLCHPLLDAFGRTVVWVSSTTLAFVYNVFLAKVMGEDRGRSYINHVSFDRGTCK